MGFASEVVLISDFKHVVVKFFSTDTFDFFDFYGVEDSPFVKDVGHCLFTSVFLCGFQCM